MRPMFELPTGRLSGSAFRALVGAVTRTPARHLVAKVLRAQLGIDSLKALGPDARGNLAFSLAPTIARCNHERPSQGLGIPTVGEWPRTSDSWARALGTGRIAAEELVERSLVAARDLSRRKPSLGPLLYYDDEGALAAAHESSERFRAKRPRGPLEGIVVAIKEEVDVKGFPTRLGTSFISEDPAREDSLPVRRLREAGAIVIGTTPMTEYGMSPLGGNVHRDMPRNAHNSGHLPGGSSSGSGVAVATGVVPVALGADGGGSIRIPAALNGVFGLKPSFGRIPVVGHGLPGGSSVVHLGPLGASSHDLAVFIEATSGADPRDPSSIDQPPLDPGELTAALGRGVRGLRIGVDEDEWSAASPEVASVGREALRVLEREGATLVPVGMRLAKHAAPIGYLTIGLETLVNLAEVRRTHMHDLGLDLQLLLANLETFPPDDYLDAQRLRGELRRELAVTLANVDVIALPTTATTAPPISDRDAREGFVDPPALDAMCRYAFLGNLSGCPAGTAPVGLDKDRLPIGLQILGDAWDEAAVLQVLAHLERTGVAQVKRPESAVDLLVELSDSFDALKGPSASETSSGPILSWRLAQNFVELARQRVRREGLLQECVGYFELFVLQRNIGHVARDEQHAQPRSQRSQADGQVATTHARHQQVRDDHVEPGADLLQGGNCCFPTGRLRDREAASLQDAARRAAHDLVVIDQQNSSRVIDGRGLPRRSGFGSRDTAMAREKDAERAADPELALDSDVSARLVDDPVHGGEPEPGASTSCFGGEERLEQPAPSVFVHPDAGVGKSQPDALVAIVGKMLSNPFGGRVHDGGCDSDCPSPRHRVAGVHDEIHQYLFDLAAIREHPGGDRVELGYELDARADQSPGQRRKLRNDSVQIDDAGPHHLSAAECQKLTREARGALRRVPDFASQLARVLGESVVSEQQLRLAENHGQEVVGIVGNTTRELGQRLELLRVQQLGAGALERRLRPSASDRFLALRVTGRGGGALGELNLARQSLGDSRPNQPEQYARHYGHCRGANGRVAERARIQRRAHQEPFGYDRGQDDRQECPEQRAVEGRPQHPIERPRVDAAHCNHA